MGHGEHLAVGLAGSERSQSDATRADNELSDAMGLIEAPPWVLRREPLVIVIVPVEHHVGAGRIQDIPERLDRQVRSMGAGAISRMVPISEDIGLCVRSEVGPEPRHLGRAGAATADRRAVRIQDYDVPGADVVAVPALRRVPGARPEVPEIPSCPRRVVVVVACGRPGAVAVAAPGRPVTVTELHAGAVRIGVVAQREDSAGDPVEQRRGRRIGGRRACGDVAGTYQDGVRRAGDRDTDDARPQQHRERDGKAPAGHVPRPWRCRSLREEPDRRWSVASHPPSIDRGSEGSIRLVAVRPEQRPPHLRPRRSDGSPLAAAIGGRAPVTAKPRCVMVEMGESRTPRPEPFAGAHYERVRWFVVDRPDGHRHSAGRSSHVSLDRAWLRIT